MKVDDNRMVKSMIEIIILCGPIIFRIFVNLTSWTYAGEMRKYSVNIRRKRISSSRLSAVWLSYMEIIIYTNAAYSNWHANA